MIDPYRNDGDERAQFPEDRTPSPSSVGDTDTDHTRKLDQNPETRVDNVVDSDGTESSANDSHTVYDNPDDDGYRYTEKDTARSKNNRKLIAIFVALIVAAVVGTVLLFRAVLPSNDDDEYYPIIESPEESTAPDQPGYGQDRDNLTGETDETDETDAVDDRADESPGDNAPESDVNESEAFLFGEDGAGTQIYTSTGDSPIGGGAVPTDDGELRQNVYNTIQEMYDVIGSVPGPESPELTNAANSYLYADQGVAYTLFVGSHAGWTIDFDRTEVFDPITEGNEPRVSVTWVTGDGQTAYIIEGYYDTLIDAIKPNYTGTTEVGQKSLYDVM